MKRVLLPDTATGPISFFFRLLKASTTGVSPVLIILGSALIRAAYRPRGEVLPSIATPLRKIEHAIVSLGAAKISRPSPSQEIDKLGQGYMNQLAHHTDTKGEYWVWKWQWKYITGANPSAVDEMLDGELLTPYIR